MNKYWTIFKISFQQEFVYKLNFVMWRVRNVLSIFLIFFLWDSVFSDPSRVVFGYDRAKILTYVFGIILIRAIVFSARSVDVPGEIAEGNLTNYLLKPVNYFKYWLTRDISSKALNLAFSVVEFGLLFLLLKPDFFLQGNPLIWLAFLLFLVLANYLIFLIRFLASFVSFWVPELAWGAQFLFLFVVAEFLSGALFPIDVAPVVVQRVLYFTPFPYLIFFPLQVYLGKVTSTMMLGGGLIALVWCLALTWMVRVVWVKGLAVYKAEGR